jgi:quinol monooxygenase YgiN
MNQSLLTIALYKPYVGKEQELNEILKTHVFTLRDENLITSLEPIRIISENGTVIEIFEWRSEEAKDQAHNSNQVMTIWNNLMEIAEMTSLSTLPEASTLFPNFKPYSL